MTRAAGSAGWAELPPHLLMSYLPLCDTHTFPLSSKSSDSPRAVIQKSSGKAPCSLGLNGKWDPDTHCAGSA